MRVCANLLPRPALRLLDDLVFAMIEGGNPVGAADSRGVGGIGVGSIHSSSSGSVGVDGIVRDKTSTAVGLLCGMLAVGPGAWLGVTGSTGLSSVPPPPPL